MKAERALDDEREVVRRKRETVTIMGFSGVGKRGAIHFFLVYE